MSVRGRHFTISDFYCVKCGNKGIPIGRRQDQQRERGHLKKIYCLYCQEETNHVEARDFDYSMIENGKEIVNNGD